MQKGSNQHRQENYKRQSRLCIRVAKLKKKTQNISSSQI
jgi:hypothetical protein